MPYVRSLRMYDKSSPESIRTLFGRIADDYDRANAVLSFGLYKGWNRALVKSLSAHGVTSLLDLCAGTGDIAFAFLKKEPQTHATLIDFCPEMLQKAHDKGKSLHERFFTLVGDAENIPLPDGFVNGVSIAYGVRNVSRPQRCFQEVYRILKPGGIVSILELTQPASAFLRLGHTLYLKTLLPLLGKWVAKDQQAYEYLAKSIPAFILPKDLISLLEKQGFVTLSCKSLTGGIATLITCKK